MLYKVLSIKHPWAGFIAEGVKPFETRKWTTSYRGPVLIHVSRAIDDDAVSHHGLPPGYRDLVDLRGELGKVICSAEIYGCRPMTPADELLAMCPSEEGRKVFALRAVQRVRPFFIRGQLGLFEVDVPEVIPLHARTPW